MATAWLLAAAPVAAAGPQVATPADVRTAAQDPVVEADAADPLTLEVAYVADVLHNAHGGIRRGTRYLDNLGVVATADLDRLAGIDRTRAMVYLLYNNGTRFSASLVGDAQVASGIETGVRATRVYQAWVEHRGPDDDWSVRAGIYDLNSEFDVLDSAAMFVGSVHGMGTDLSQSGTNGPSTFPSTSLALRVDAVLSDRVRVRVAVLDGVPNDPDRPGRMLIHLGEADGAMFVGEGELTLGGVRLIAGGWTYTAHESDHLDEALGLPDAGRVRNGGVYLRGEAQVTGTRDRGLRGFVRLGLADEHANAFGALVSGGLMWRGLLPSRAGDETGIAVARAIAGHDQRVASRVLHGRADAAETAFELTHRFVLSDWLSLQPDVQYIVNPGLDPRLRDALVVGVRFAATLAL